MLVAPSGAQRYLLHPPPLVLLPQTVSLRGFDILQSRPPLPHTVRVVSATMKRLHAVLIHTGRHVSLKAVRLDCREGELPDLGWEGACIVHILRLQKVPIPPGVAACADDALLNFRFVRFCFADARRVHIPSSKHGSKRVIPSRSTGANLSYTASPTRPASEKQSRQDIPPQWNAPQERVRRRLGFSVLPMPSQGVWVRRPSARG